MALNNLPKEIETAVGTSRGPGEPESVSDDEKEEIVEVEEMEKLESEAKEMAKRILDYRATLPDQLKATLSSILSSQRPVLPEMDSGSNFGPSGKCNPGLLVSSFLGFRIRFASKDENENLRFCGVLGFKVENFGKISDIGLGERVKASKSALLAEGDHKIAEKVGILKDKISSNMSAMPIVLKRMKEFMSKIENLDSYDGTIHPAFKKKKTS
ncbi:hypothetical protein GH714_038811 [Hevea brasiliensis]|uniref:Uncharacterized protein n=1 Tax=Hevea brasiliensis TaxID=3981 RepID=A0A6A6MRX3_HEVBR|nr:hypothetical protein GH714_038811 [Hevea brasiliensis]